MKITNYKLQITNKSQIQNYNDRNWFRNLVIGICVLFGICVLGFGNLTYAEIIGSSVDPMRIGVPARPLGMGKAYVGFAEDSDTVFLNPAGLSKIDTLKFTSMYASLMGEVKYTVVSVANPLGDGVLGAGFISAGIENIALYQDKSTPLGTVNYSSNVAFLSYGREIFKNLSIGGNLKYFSSGATGSALVEDSAGSGMNLDLSVLYSPTKWLSAGLTAQNALPASLGGKMVYRTGLEEEIPSTLKIGGSIGVLGTNAIVPSLQKLNLAGDVDLSVARKRPITMHIGGEYWPIRFLAIRAGIDQDALNDSQVISNPTLGIGLRFEGFEFNYAFHPYAGISGDETHFFSISYVGKEKKPLIAVTEPQDELITYDSEIKVSGKVETKTDGLKIQIDGKEVSISEDSKFEKTVELAGFGKRQITIKVSDYNGYTEVIKKKVLRLTSFRDISIRYWAKSQIEYAATTGLVQGYPDQTFKPEQALTRAEFATLLIRAKGVGTGEAKDVSFKDVGSDHWAAKYIAVAEEEGLIKGYPDKTFRPNDKINRAEAITVFARFDNLKLRESLSESPFEDLSKDHWAAKYIAAAKDAGMLRYLGGRDFEAGNNLSRAEAVEILTKTSLGYGKIGELLDFTVGFGEVKEVPKPRAKMDRKEDRTFKVLSKDEVISKDELLTLLPEKDRGIDIDPVITRGSLIMILGKLGYITPPALGEMPEPPYEDLTPRDPLAKYVFSAKKAGILDYLTETKFKPETLLTISEAEKIISKAIKSVIASK